MPIPISNFNIVGSNILRDSIEGKEKYARILIQAGEDMPYLRFRKEGNTLVFDSEEGAEQAMNFLRIGTVGQKNDLIFDSREDIKEFWDSLIDMLRYAYENLNDGPICDYLQAQVLNISEEPKYSFNLYNFIHYMLCQIIVKYKCRILDRK